MKRFDPLTGTSTETETAPAKAPARKRKTAVSKSPPPPVSEASAQPAALPNATTAAPVSKLARAAAAVPLATYRALVPLLDTCPAGGNAEDHRTAFTWWCETHAENFRDWRQSHLAYLQSGAGFQPAIHGPQAGSLGHKIVPFVQPPPPDRLAHALANLR